MTRGLYARPWGDLGWIMTSLPGKKWSVVTCVSPEERWSATLRTLITAGGLGDATLYRIAPTAIGEDQDRALELLREQEGVALALVEDIGEHHTVSEPIGKLAASIDRFLGRAGDNILIDISCFPKRFFFPIVKLVSEADAAQNVVVTYAHADAYPTGRLAEDPEPSRPLPMFTGALVGDDPRQLIISTGVEPLGISQVIESDGGYASIKVLFPYPAPPPLGRRNWEVLRLIHQSQSIPESDVIGIDVMDLPNTFSRLEQLGGNTPSAVSLAPFGAKPVSLAMCLYALSVAPERRPAVLYTQPRRYNPQYSIGVKQGPRGDSITAYMLRHSGQHLYPLNS